MRRLKIIFICKLTICLLTWSVFVAELDALRGSAVVLQARAKADKKNSDQDETIDVDENEEQVELNVTTTTKPTLTGIPQIDYVHDPNLPRELNGYNLTDYPFLNSVPPEIEFKCDGLHDGFYASMPHKCQLYHHCLFGTRFDFLCANYTAFDQKTFICHFVSQVDCPNSAKYYNRNEALYKTAETTTLSTTTTSTSTTPSPPPQQQQQQQQYYPQYQQQQYQPQQQQQQQQFQPQQQQQYQPQQQQFQQQQQMPYEGRRAMAPGYAQGRKRRPTYRRRRPVYEYYYVDDYDDQQDYYDESVEPMPVVKKPIRKHSRFNNHKPTDLDVDYLESSSESDVPPSGNYKNNRGQQQHHQQQQHQQQQQQPQQYQQQQRQQSTAVTKNASNQITSVYDKPRAPPKIRRPVPINERDRYDYMSPSKTSGQQQPAVQAAPAPATSTTTTTTEAPTTAKSTGKGAKEQQPQQQRQAVTEEPIEYYDEDEEELPAEDEYVAEPEVPAAKPAAVAKSSAAAVVAKPAVAASKPELVRAAARTAVVTDYDGDRGRRPSPVQANRPKASSPRVVPLAVVQPQPVTSVPARKRLTADDYEDELPAAATRQSIAAATKQRASGPFVSRPTKARAPLPPAAAAMDAVEYEEEEPAAAYQPLPVQQQQPQQQTRQSQRVSVRQVMAAQHRPRPQLQSSAADHPHAQFNNNNHNSNKFVRAASTSNRRPAAAVRPVYEYADEYYDE